MMFLQQMSHGVLSKNGCSVLTALSPKKKKKKSGTKEISYCVTNVIQLYFMQISVRKLSFLNFGGVVEVNGCMYQLQRQKSLK